MIRPNTINLIIEDLDDQTAEILEGYLEELEDSHQEGLPQVPTEWLQNLRLSITGDCYMGDDWELSTIDALLSYKPQKDSK